MIFTDKDITYFMSPLSRYCLLLFSLCVLTACASGTRWNDSRPNSRQTPQSTTRTTTTKPPTTTTRHTGKRPATHTVQKGDSFWSIARRYGISVNELTSWNNMTKNDVIFSGMKLKLYPSSSNSTTSASTSSSGSSNNSTTSSSSINLQWPLQGRIINKFNAQNNTIKGLEIGGLKGQRIKAAADGTVVYAGSGLVGLGNVIIIKHDSTFITAYGHNEKLLKLEGEKVKQGDEIAIIGVGPNNQTMVYFEVRKNGKPVDPMGYLKK